MPAKRRQRARDEPIDPQLVKVLAHPLRVRILGILEQRTASPSEISQELDTSLGVVSYHVRRLHSLGLIKLVRKTPRRGAIEHHYRVDPDRQMPDPAWDDLPDVVRRAMVGSVVGRLGARVNAAAAEGGLEVEDAHVSLTELVLDERGWSAIARELERTLERARRIQAESAERLQAGGRASEERRAALGMMLFEGPGGRPDPD